MIEAPQDSGITITNKKWQIVVDQYTGYKELEFYCTKSDLWNQHARNLANGKIMGKWQCTLNMIMYSKIKF